MFTIGIVWVLLCELARSHLLGNLSKDSLTNPPVNISQILLDIEFTSNILQNIDISVLRNASMLENDLLLQFGLNAEEFIKEFPSHLYPYCDKGLRSWQYPSQFSKFLVYLSTLKINSYLEIGTRHGGTFIIINEYLRRFNGPIKSIGIDPYYSPIMHTYASQWNDSITYVIDRSTSSRYIELTQFQFDFCFIDGDHLLEPLLMDFQMIKNNCKYIAFHDIFSSACEPVGNVWNKIKFYYPKRSIMEFIGQYEEVYQRTNETYLGIGVVTM